VQFPASPVLGEPLSPTVIWLAAETPGDGPCPSAKLKSIEQYGKYLLDDVERRTHKPFEPGYMSWETVCTWPTAEELASISPAGVAAPPMGAWIAKSICLVPIQICRCENNALVLLSDGLPHAFDPDVKDVADIAKQITFGPYEAIFQSCNDAVLVVTSMGAQSTGKSYQLNHLGGTLFDVSGEHYCPVVEHEYLLWHLPSLIFAQLVCSVAKEGMQADWKFWLGT
jgi:hypothetical protein